MTQCLAAAVYNDASFVVISHGATFGTLLRQVYYVPRTIYPNQTRPKPTQMPPQKPSTSLSPKIFGIGFNKTGTTTLKHCYEELHLTPIAPTGGEQIKRLTHKIFDDNDYEPMLKKAKKYRSFEDRPWNIWEAYRHLDERFPGSLFILTVREPENWWRSVERWISVSKPWMAQRYRAHLRSDNLLPESMISAYQSYNQEVREYFANTDRLLEINFEAGQGWPELCTFLNVPLPQKPIPHVNTQSYSQKDDRRRSKRVKKNSRKRQKRLKNRLQFYRLTSAGCQYCKTRSWRIQQFRRWVKGLLSGPRQWSVSESKTTPMLDMNSPPLAFHPRQQPDDNALGVVCCYINPLRSAAVRQDFEMSYHTLAASNANILVVEALDESNPVSDLPTTIPSLQVTTGPIWSRNHLLNCGIRTLLAEGLTQIAWLDEGVRLDSPLSWAQQVKEALTSHHLVQAFDVATVSAGNISPVQQTSAVKYRHEHGNLPENHSEDYHGGYAWAARAELLEKILLYDALPFDADPRMLFTASYPIDAPWFEDMGKLTHYQFSPCKICFKSYPACDLRWDCLTWAQRWSQAVSGKLGYVSENITVSRHSKDNARQLMDVLMSHNYRPKTDVSSAQPNDWHFEPEDKSFLRAVREASPLA